MREVILDVIATLAAITFAALALHNRDAVEGEVSTLFGSYSKALNTAGSTR